ncbi:MAG: class I SAM-dependent methyltransferase [Mycobacterium sp.]
MNAISKTAFFCCGIRAEDAKAPGSICADIYADDFMTDEGRSISARFAGNPRRNASNVVRSRIFQDRISKYLKQNKELQVVNIGAGFDSRAYRLAGGRWSEFDEPAIIEHKNTRVPTDTCPNPLQRIAVDFGAGELPVALRQCDPEAETLVVIEGVFMYLDRTQVRELLDTLSSSFPNHTLICDLMDKTFFDRHLGKMYDQILALGSEFKLLESNPEQLFLDHGYTQQDDPISIVGRARDFNAIWVPGLLLNTALKSLRDGYRAHTFHRSQ